MSITLNVPQYSVTEDTVYWNDLFEEHKKLPMLCIGRDSYIEETQVEANPDQDLLYNVQLGRYSSIARDTKMIIDLNHDYKRVCQGRISGVAYQRPHLIRRKGQVIIMNDCWIGNGVIMLGGIKIGNGAVVAAGAVVTKDVPPYAIVAGNPAKVIGYRFEPEQIAALNKIRWWNWTAEKVRAASELLLDEIDSFIERYLPQAEQEIARIPQIEINPIEKILTGEDKRLLYIPDFEQDYPTYPRVIDAFVSSYANTNCELLLYVKEDAFVPDKLAVLDRLFEQYADVDCYVNVYVGNLEDERGLFAQNDAYITNRSLDNVRHMDMADFYGIPVISSVNLPIFTEQDVQGMCKL